MLYLGLILLGFLFGFYVKGFHVPDIAVVVGFLTGQVVRWGFGFTAMMLFKPTFDWVQSSFKHWRVQHFFLGHRGLRASQCKICV